MRLKDWLRETGLKQKDFATLVDVKPPTISRIISGSLMPSRELITRIDAVTKGRVSWRDWKPAKKTMREEGESAIRDPT